MTPRSAYPKMNPMRDREKESGMVILGAAGRFSILIKVKVSKLLDRAEDG